MNVSTLGQAVSKDDVSYYQELYGHKKPLFIDGIPGGAYYILFLSIVFLVGAAFFIILTVGTSYQVAGIVIALTFTIIVAVLIGALVLGIKSQRAYWRKITKLSKLAANNGWEYKRFNSGINQLGSVFMSAKSRNFDHTITAQNFVIGECVAAYDYGRYVKFFPFVYITIPLDKKVPNMLLDAKSNNKSLFRAAGSNLPIRYDSDQKISLEGDFDKYFVLYAPKGYDVDARYIFTPDVMASFIDEAFGIDVEIVDNAMHVYIQNGKLDDPKIWERASSIIDTIGNHMRERAEFYSDDKSPERATVALQGRRLKYGVPIIAVIIGITFFILEVGVRLIQLFGE